MTDETYPVPQADLERVRQALHAATTADLAGSVSAGAGDGRRRRRTRLVVATFVACLVVASAAVATQGFLGERTSGSIDELARSRTIRAGFAKLLHDPAITAGTTLTPGTPIAKAFDLPSDSAYAGHSLYVAAAPRGWTCVEALDGAACGQLTDRTPTVGFILAHPSSGLPVLAAGVVRADVTAVSFRCPSATDRATMIGAHGYLLILRTGQSLDGCRLVATAHG
jgi:hypothetical protein